MLTILYPAGFLQDFFNNLAFYKVNKAASIIFMTVGVRILSFLAGWLLGWQAKAMSESTCGVVDLRSSGALRRETENDYAQ